MLKVEENFISPQKHKIKNCFVSVESKVLKEERKDQEIDFVDIPVIDISSAISLSEQKKLKSTEWAEIIDVNSTLENFDELIPNPAFTWPFELDRFQKHVRFHYSKL